MPAILSLLIMVILTLPGIAHSHDNKYVHPLGITAQSMQMLSATSPSTYFELDRFFDDNPPVAYPSDTDGTPAESLAPMLKWGTRGSLEEDIPLWRTYNHFYNPFTNNHGLSLVGYYSAFEKAQELWPSAVASYDYTSDSKQYAFHYIGRILHLLEDMSVPAHLHNDAHINKDDGPSGTSVGDHNR